MVISVRKAHLPNRYVLLYFCTKKLAWPLPSPDWKVRFATRLYYCASTPSLLVFFRYFNDFLVLKVSVREAHLPDEYFLIFFCPENTALLFSEPRLIRSFCYMALFFVPAPLLYVVFRVFNDLHVLNALVTKLLCYLKPSLPSALLLSGKYILTLFRSQFETIKLLHDSIHSAKTEAKTPFIVVFRDFNDFHGHRVSVGQAHLPNWYYML